MNKEQKQHRVAELKGYFAQYGNFYVVNTESLTVAQVNTLRRACFEEGVIFKVAKNTLIRRALQELTLEHGGEVNQALHGVSALLFCENPKTPAVIISDFRNQNPGDRPQFKVAVIDGGIYGGDNQLAVLKNLKSKQELIGELVGLLQSPLNRVLGGLNSGGGKLAALLKALESRA